jgi:hypothetical protein
MIGNCFACRDEQEKRHDGPTHTKRIVREGNDGRYE